MSFPTRKDAINHRNMYQFWYQLEPHLNLNVTLSPSLPSSSSLLPSSSSHCPVLKLGNGKRRVSNHRKAWEQGSPLTAACANLAILRCFSCSWSMAVLRWSREKLNPEHREERACNAALHPASSSSKPRWDLEGRSTLTGIGAGTHGSLTGQAPAPQHHCHTVQREAAPDGP